MVTDADSISPTSWIEMIRFNISPQKKEKTLYR